MSIEPRYTKEDRERVRQHCLANSESSHDQTATACAVHPEYARKIRRGLVGEGLLETLRSGGKLDPTKPKSRAHKRTKSDRRHLGLEMPERDQLHTARIRIKYLEDQVADLDLANKELAAKLFVVESLLAGLRP